MSTATVNDNSKKSRWKTLVGMLGVLTILFLIVSPLTGWDRDWQIWRTEKRLAQEEKYQTLRQKDAHADNLENKTNRLIDRAGEGRDTNSRFNRRLEEYRNRIEGVGIEPHGGPQEVPAPTPREVANLEDFQVLEADDANLEYKFQLDARVPQQMLATGTGSLKACGGDTLEFSAAGRVCPLSNRACNGPNGHGGRPIDVSPEKWTMYDVDEYPVKGAYFDSLVGYIGDQQFQIGEHKPWQAPSGILCQDIRVGYNIRRPETPRATGGSKLAVKITRKNQ